MWLLKTLLFVVLLAFFVTLAVQNNESPGVQIHLFGWTSVEMAVWVVIFISAVVGFILGMIVAAIREIRLRLDLGKLKRRNSELEKELVSLRAAPLEAAEIPAAGDEDGM